MRILLTGAGSGLGRAAARHLIAAGHDVTGISEAGHPMLDARVRLHRGPLTGPVLQDLADEADAIVHLAPVEPGEPDAAGPSGVLAVSDAAGRSGSRLLFVVPAAGDPDTYRYPEQLVTSSWAPSLVIRVAPLLGREPIPMVARTVHTLRRRGGPESMRLLHVDDLLRFLSRAVGSHRTGTVDLAIAEPVSVPAARRWLAGAGLPLRHRSPWTDPDPGYKLLPLQRDWEFSCGWTGLAAVIDTARGCGRRLHPGGAAPPRITVEVPGTDLIDAAPIGQAGELDDRIDARFPVFVAPPAAGPDDRPAGPLSPLSLDLHAGGLGCAQRAVAAALGLPAGLGEEWTHRATAVFGHRFYAGQSVATAVGELGVHRATTHPRLLTLAGRYGAECDALTLDVATDAGIDTAVGELSDAALSVRIRLLGNRIRQGWTTTTLGLLIEDTLGPVAERRAPLAWSLRLAGAAMRLDLAGLPDAPAGTLETPGAGQPPALTRRLLDTARAGREKSWQLTLADLTRLAAAVTEAGRRMAAVRALAAAADVHLLTCEEIAVGPLDSRLRVKRRRADADRLAAMAMPALIDGRWGPGAQRDAG